jgi:hypothetical protein
VSNKRAVRISNSCGRGWTSRKQADRFVKKGQARWNPDGTLSFIEDDFGHISATRSAARQVFTDGTGMATLAAIAGLPVIQPIKLITGHRKAA